MLSRSEPNTADDVFVTKTFHCNLTLSFLPLTENDMYEISKLTKCIHGLAVSYFKLPVCRTFYCASCSLCRMPLHD